MELTARGRVDCYPDMALIDFLLIRFNEPQAVEVNLRYNDLTLAAIAVIYKNQGKQGVDVGLRHKSDAEKDAAVKLETLKEIETVVLLPPGQYSMAEMIDPETGEKFLGLDAKSTFARVPSESG